MTDLDFFLQQLVSGLTIGLIYALIAIGYTMVYGIVQLINFAHGEIFMVGAYLGLSVLLALDVTQTAAGIALGGVLLLMFLAAMAGCGILGMSIERVAYRPLRDAPRLAPLITAIGMSFVLQNVVMLLFGPVDRPFPALFPKAQFTFGHTTVTLLQLFIGVVAVAFMAALHLFVKKSRAGKAMRACAEDRTAASLMGIPIDRMISLAFLIGSALAGAGGVLFGLYYNTINFHDGYLAGLKAFSAAVLGGIGNIPGAMVGGVLIGLVEGLGAGYLSSEWKNVFAFVVLILVLLLRPQGLLGERVSKKV